MLTELHRRAHSRARQEEQQQAAIAASLVQVCTSACRCCAADSSKCLSHARCSALLGTSHCRATWVVRKGGCSAGHAPFCRASAPSWQPPGGPPPLPCVARHRVSEGRFGTHPEWRSLITCSREPACGQAYPSGRRFSAASTGQSGRVAYARERPASTNACLSHDVHELRCGRGLCYSLGLGLGSHAILRASVDVRLLAEAIEAEHPPGCTRAPLWAAALQKVQQQGRRLQLEQASMPSVSVA